MVGHRVRSGSYIKDYNTSLTLVVDEEFSEGTCTWFLKKKINMTKEARNT
jgi:hypothetical protein